MWRWLPILFVAALTASGYAREPQSQAPRFPSHPDFKVTPEAPAIPKALMKLPRTAITRAKFPAIDFHFHGRTLGTADDYQKLIGSWMRRASASSPTWTVDTAPASIPA